MDKVFITHSRHDAPILKHIKVLVEIAKVKPIFYQYDDSHVKTAWQEIRYDIQNSHALFVVLSNNLSSSAYTQNWVGWEVGVACAFDKRVWIFEEIKRKISFPIPYLTDYVPYDLNNPQLRDLISAVARGYNIQPQTESMIGLGLIGAVLFNWPGLLIGSIIGNIVNKPKQPPSIELMCYHLNCKTRFRTYVWYDTMECPACRRILKFKRIINKEGKLIIYPNPNPKDLSYANYNYAWYDKDKYVMLFKLNIRT